MAQKITQHADGTLNVPNDPIIPFIEGDGTGVDIWPAAKLVLDAAAKKHGRTIEWLEVLAGDGRVLRTVEADGTTATLELGAAEPGSAPAFVEVSALDELGQTLQRSERIALPNR